MKTLRKISDLQEENILPDEARFEELSQRYAIAISPNMQKELSSPAVARQFVPDLQELDVLQDELLDPIGDEAHSPVKGLIHRYEDRVLLKASHRCAVYCRFCFRREQVGDDGEDLNEEEFEQALSYIQEHSELWEVILTGGDPLFLPLSRLEKILQRLDEIEHVKIVRFHTRVPVVSPELIRPELIDLLKKSTKTAYVVIHCNHADELNEAAQKAIAQLVDGGVPLLSQSVLLREVNNSVEALTSLFRRLVELRVKPYYLHHLDKAQGTSHFRCSISEGQELMKKLRGQLSGLCLPEYILDIPSGFGKVPIQASYLQQTISEGYEVEDPQGKTHFYKIGQESLKCPN